MSDFKTVYPGVYSPREEEILSATREKLDARSPRPFRRLRRSDQTE